MNSNRKTSASPNPVSSDSERTRGIVPIIRSFSADNLPPVSVTKAIALAATRGTIYYHRTERNRDGTALRCRVNGKCKVWKTRPIDYQLPVVHGLKAYFYLTHRNSDVWLITDPTVAVYEGAQS